MVQDLKGGLKAVRKLEEKEQKTKKTFIKKQYFLCILYVSYLLLFFIVVHCMLRFVNIFFFRVTVDEVQQVKPTEKKKRELPKGKGGM